MSLRERADKYPTGTLWEFDDVVETARAELLRAADAVANMHGESATKIAAYLRKQAE